MDFYEKREQIIKQYIKHDIEQVFMPSIYLNETNFETKFPFRRGRIE